MKLLYLSCHSILEYDEIRIFADLGIDVFSFGTYHNPQKIDDSKRPTLDLPYHKDLEALCSKTTQEDIPQEVIDWADVIVCMHKPDWLIKNWEKFKGKRVIERTIGQNMTDNENILKALIARGLEIVRYSPFERTIPGYAGENAMIRFAKKPEEFGCWTGKEEYVLNVTQDLFARGGACNSTFYDLSTRGFPRVLIGKGSEILGKEGWGVVPLEKMQEAMRNCSCYFYTGTYPASYTLNFIEALMTGCPIIALGDKFGNNPRYPEFKLYEITEFAKKSGGILCANSPEEARSMIRSVLVDGAFREQMSKENRELAIKLFGYEKIKKEWEKFLFEGEHILAE
jgi:hypothetical protein